MNPEGWIKLSRKTLNNPVVMKDAEHLGLWVYLLLNVSRGDQDVLFKGERIKLEPGQMTTGRKKLAKTLNISQAKVERILLAFTSEQQIEQRTSNSCRLITVKNWSRYQMDEQRNGQRPDNDRTTTGQRPDTKQEVKKLRLREISSARRKRPQAVRVTEGEGGMERPEADLSKDGQKHIQVIGLLASVKGITFANQEQQRSFITRYLRAARSLVGYEMGRIEATMRHLQANADFKWTLETVGKFIDELEQLSAKNETLEEKLEKISQKYANKPA